MSELRLNSPFAGLNTYEEDGAVPKSMFREVENVDFCRGTLFCRPGTTTKRSDTRKILGMVDYRKKDGTIQLLAKAEGSLLRYLDADGTWTEIKTGLDQYAYADFEIFGDRAYFTDGTGLFVTDGTSVFDAQIETPASTPTVALSAGAGNKRGTYDYKVTFYSTDWGQESPSSGPSSTIEAIDKDIELTSIPSPASEELVANGGRVDAKRIYRRKISSSETEWFFVAEIDVALTVFTDNVLDSDTSNIRIAPPTYDEVLPAFNAIHAHNSVMYLFGDDDRLWFTGVNQPWSLANFIVVGGEGSLEKITGLVSYAGVLVILKENSVWVLSGAPGVSAQVRRVYESRGCSCIHSSIQANGLVYFIGDDHVYSFDGSTVAPISGPIQDTISNRDKSLDGYVFGFDLTECQAVAWGFAKESGGLYPDRLLLFFYGNSERAGAPSWSEWTFFHGGPTSAVRKTYETDRSRRPWIGFDSGAIVEIKNRADDSGYDDIEPISMRVKTAKVDANIPAHMKVWDRGFLTCSQVPEGASVGFRYYADGDEAGSEDQWIEIDRGCRWFSIRAASREMELEFYSDDAGMVEVTDAGFEVDNAGTVHGT